MVPEILRMKTAVRVRDFQMRGSRMNGPYLCLLAILYLAGVVGGACSRKPGQGTAGDLGLREGSARYAGSYLLRPSLGPSRLELHADGTTTVWTTTERLRGAYQVTSQSLRIFVTPEKNGPQRLAPIGVFLVSEYDTAWRGMWDGDVTFLVKDSGSARPSEPEQPGPSTTSGPGPPSGTGTAPAGARAGAN